MAATSLAYAAALAAVNEKLADDAQEVMYEYDRLRRSGGENEQALVLADQKGNDRKNRSPLDHVFVHCTGE